MDGRRFEDRSAGARRAYDSFTIAITIDASRQMIRMVMAMAQLRGTPIGYGRHLV
jgi:hypothetical protein